MNYDFNDEALKYKEKSDIRYFGIAGACAVLGYFLLSFAWSFAIEFLGVQQLVAGTKIANESFSMLATIAVILIPFSVAAHFEKKRTDIDIVPLGKPNDPLLFVLAVPSGIALCLLGSIVTNLISILFSDIDVTLTQPDLSAPQSGYAMVIYVIRLTVLAALMEEICFRGIIMQPLRKYGNFFGISMAAIVFALMHGNLVQAPAAFISGLAIGYFTVATGTIWTGVLIHFSNNALVAVEQYLLTQGNEDMFNTVATFATYGLIIVGLVCLPVFYFKRKSMSLSDGMPASQLSVPQRLKAYFLNPAMIIMLLLVAYVTSWYIE